MRQREELPPRVLAQNTSRRECFGLVREPRLSDAWLSRLSLSHLPLFFLPSSFWFFSPCSFLLFAGNSLIPTTPFLSLSMFTPTRIPGFTSPSLPVLPPTTTGTSFGKANTRST